MGPYRLPFHEVEEDDGGCGDPECCGGQQNWVDLVDADGVVIFSGRAAGNDLSEIKAAFRALAEQRLDNRPVTLQS